MCIDFVIEIDIRSALNLLKIDTNRLFKGRIVKILGYILRSMPYFVQS